MKSTALSDDWKNYMSLAREVQKELSARPVAYEYMGLEQFQATLLKDPKRGNQIYATELLYRAHFVGVAGFMRSYRWAQGVELAAERNLFLPFCACSRGLLEAGADLVHSAKGVPLTLAKYRTLFNRAIEKKLDHMLIADELESALIHFSHARRLGKGEKGKAPESHVAREPKTYIDGLNGFIPGGWYEWYVELCQYSHPAAQSTAYMVVPESDSHFHFLADADEVYLAEYLEQWSKQLAGCLTLALAPALLVLKILRYFRMPSLHVKAISQMDFSAIDAWKSCAVEMKVPAR